jgi:OOP family OmpA-OmpF porin
MPSFRATWCVAIVLLSVATARRADAQTQPAQGFAVERLYPSAAGGGWFVMDSLSMHGGLGGALELTTGYAYKPLRVATSDGTQRLAPVVDQAFADVSLAVTYARVRFSLDLPGPLLLSGRSGIVGSYSYSAPSADPGRDPDTFSDVRIGFDARLLGDPAASFRLGVGGQLWIPSGERVEYVTDGTYRGMLRVLVAGDEGMLTYAGHVGVHIRPIDEPQVPGSPQGSELLFGAAGGVKVPAGQRLALVVGPEVFGETAFRSFLGSSTFGLEGLLTGRLEETGEDGAHLRVKLGVGGGLDAHFGVPELRAILAVEVFGQNAGREH